VIFIEQECARAVAEVPAITGNTGLVSSQPALSRMYRRLGHAPKILVKD